MIVSVHRDIQRLAQTRNKQGGGGGQPNDGGGKRFGTRVGRMLKSRPATEQKELARDIDDVIRQGDVACREDWVRVAIGPLKIS